MHLAGPAGAHSTPFFAVNEVALEPAILTVSLSQYLSWEINVNCPGMAGMKPGSFPSGSSVENS